MITIHRYVQRFMLGAALVAGITTPAPAQLDRARTPCNETVDKFCKDVIPGNGRLIKCLNDHRDDQSIACKDWIEDQQKSMQDLMGICAEDIARWCRNSPPDKASIYFCLMDNYISLRLDCRSRLGEVRDRLR